MIADDQARSTHMEMTVSIGQVALVVSSSLVDSTKINVWTMFIKKVLNFRNNTSIPKKL